MSITITIENQKRLNTLGLVKESNYEFYNEIAKVKDMIKKSKKIKK